MVLQRAATDSARLIIYTKLYIEYAESNRDSALYFIDQGIDIARKNKKKIDEALFLQLKAYQLYHENKLGESYKIHQETLSIAEDSLNEQESWSLN